MATKTLEANVSPGFDSSRFPAFGVTVDVVILTMADAAAVARKLTEFAMGTYGGLSWTRDGKAIVYPALTQRRMQLFRIAVDGGSARQLSHDAANLFEPGGGAVQGHVGDSRWVQAS